MREPELLIQKCIIAQLLHLYVGQTTQKSEGGTQIGDAAEPDPGGFIDLVFRQFLKNQTGKGHN